MTFTATGKIALVMANGPARGQAGIFVDGSRVGTADTRATANTNRIVVLDAQPRGGFESAVSGAGVATGRAGLFGRVLRCLLHQRGLRVAA